MSEQFVVVVKNSPRDRAELEKLVQMFARGQVGEITIAPDRTARIVCADEQRAKAIEKGLHGKNVSGQRQPLRASIEKVAPSAQPAGCVLRFGQFPPSVVGNLAFCALGEERGKCPPERARLAFLRWLYHQTALGSEP